MVICMSCLLSPRSVHRPAQRAGGELGNQVPLVVHRPALVGSRAAVLGRDLSGLREAGVGGRLTTQELFRLGRDEMLGTDGGQADSSLADRRVRVSIKPHNGCRCGHRPIAYAALNLFVGTASARTDGHMKLDEELTRSYDRLVGPDMELAYGDLPGPVRPPDHRRGAHRGERRGKIL